MCLFGTGLDASIQPLAYLEFGVGDLELGQFHGEAHSVRRTEPREDTCLLHLLCGFSPIDHLCTYLM